MMYPTVFGAHPIMYPPIAMLQTMTVPMQHSQMQPMANTEETENKPNQQSASNTIPNNGLFQRPASQATSVKAEPGSVMGSIASASVANRVSSLTIIFITCYIEHLSLVYEISKSTLNIYHIHGSVYVLV